MSRSISAVNNKILVHIREINRWNVTSWDSNICTGSVDKSFEGRFETDNPQRTDVKQLYRPEYNVEKVTFVMNK